LHEIQNILDGGSRCWNHASYWRERYVSHARRSTAIPSLSEDDSITQTCSGHHFTCLHGTDEMSPTHGNSLQRPQTPFSLQHLLNSHPIQSTLPTTFAACDFPLDGDYDPQQSSRRKRLPQRSALARKASRRYLWAHTLPLPSLRVLLISRVLK